jgi:hypothetical protein
MANRYQRDPRTGRFARPVANVDATSRFGPMGDSVEDIENVSAADVMPGMSRPRHAPEADGGGWWPLHRRIATLVPPDESATTVYANDHGSVMREVARHGGSPFDPTQWLTGADDGLTPEGRADALARRQAPPQVTVHGDVDAG